MHKNNSNNNDPTGIRKEDTPTEVRESEERKTDRSTDVLSKALRSFEDRLLNDSEFKLTFAEYLKLLQIEREEASAEAPREITVTWVDPPGNSEEK